MCDFNVRIPKALRDDFKRLCEAHGLTTCHVMVALLNAAVESFRRGVTFEWDARTEEARLREGSNPLNVNIYQNFLGKPRSSWKVPLSSEIRPVIPRLPGSGPGDQDEARCVWCGAPGVIWTAQFLTAHRYQKRWFCLEHAPRRLGR